MYVITHKEFRYKIPSEYVPLLVGADFNTNTMGYLADNTGDNISAKNKNFCELTGMYWLWKNCDNEQIGISHYRRYFSAKKTLNNVRLEALITNRPKAIPEQKLIEYLREYDWIIPQPVEVSACGQTVYEQFEDAHNIQDLKQTKQVIAELYPDYLDAFEKIMKQTKMSMYNMLYTSFEQYSSYCEWLFNILFTLEKRLDIRDYDEYQQRIFGFLSERLFNIWLEKSNVKVKRLPVFNTSTENRKGVIEKIKSEF